MADACVSLFNCLATTAALLCTVLTCGNARCDMRQGWSWIPSGPTDIVVVSDSTLCCPCSCKAGKGSADEYYFNPLKCPLPKAPKMEMFCLYGVGIPTERSYYYLNLESEEVRQSFCIRTNISSYHVVTVGLLPELPQGTASSFTLPGRHCLSSSCEDGGIQAVMVGYEELWHMCCTWCVGGRRHTGCDGGL